MKSEFWHQRWQENQIGFHQPEINSYMKAHWSELFLDRGTVFVPLCGKSSDMLWLRDQGHKVIASELSSVAVRDFFKENGLTPTVTDHERYQRWSADQITIHHEAGKRLDPLVTELDRLAARLHSDDPGAKGAKILDLISQNYTMQSERRVHAEVRQGGDLSDEIAGPDHTGLGSNVELF